MYIHVSSSHNANMVGLFYLLLPVVFFFKPSFSYSHVFHSLTFIHRHGDRTPIKFCSDDKYANLSYWPDGNKMLTIAGKQRMYNLGLYLRSRYSAYLKFSPREIWIQSSDTDRSLESATLISNAMYKPKGRWIWNQEQNWQPIAIHTMRSNVDGMLHPDAICPKFDAIKSKREQSPEVKALQNKYNKSLTILKDKCKDDLTLTRISDAYDAFKIENDKGLHVDWMNEEILKDLYQISLAYFNLSCSTKEEISLKIGLFYANLREHLIQSATNESYQYKVHHYSSHDIIINCILHGLEAYNELLIPFGATILFELWSDGNGNFTVRTYYLNETQSEKPIELNLGFCPFDCPLEIFLKHMDQYMITDWNENCNDNSSSLFIIILIFLASFVLFLCIVLFLYIVVLLMKRCSRRSRYEIIYDDRCSKK